jgi:hypothetical protein
MNDYTGVLRPFEGAQRGDSTVLVATDMLHTLFELLGDDVSLERAIDPAWTGAPAVGSI